MRLKHIILGAAVASLVGGSALVSQASADTFIPLFTYRTGPFANSGIPIANGMHDYLNMLNARDGGIGGSKLVVEECETGYKNEKGVECYDSMKSKHPVVISPYSTGITLALDSEGRGRSHPGPVDGLRPLRLGGRQGLPVDLQSAVDLLGRPVDHHPLYRRQGRRARQAQGQDHRLHLLRRWLWPRAVAALARLRQGLRLRREGVSGAGGADAEPVKPLAQRSPRQARLHDHVGLGRDEPDRGAGSRQDRLSGRPLHRHLVVRQRGRRASGRRRRQGLPVAQLQRGGRELPGDPGHREGRDRQGQQPDAEGQGRRELLQSRRDERRGDRRGHPQRAENHRQEGHHR